MTLAVRVQTQKKKQETLANSAYDRRRNKDAVKASSVVYNLRYHSQVQIAYGCVVTNQLLKQQYPYLQSLPSARELLSF